MLFWKTGARIVLGLMVIAIRCSPVSVAGPPATSIDADLLIVGGSESACAAAVQAARMGVESIVLVNDITWLGGQFSAEALAAVDESANQTGSEPGVRHNLPLPRSGLFQEIITRIEAVNAGKYGRARPGNTRVVTTCRPADAAAAFRKLLAPYVEPGQLRVLSDYEPVAVDSTGGRVTGVRFRSTEEGRADLSVAARLTIDASDWGDVVKLSGAAYEYGPDPKSKYNEPEAPSDAEDYPATDMNPITYVAVIEETQDDCLIGKPPAYDRRVYDASPYPKNHDFFYTSRRIIDHYNFADVTHPDVILLCSPVQDYPLDVYPPHVAAALEASQPGASRKNIVELTPAQRRIVFADAKQRTLGLLYWLQTALDESLADKSHTFRRFRLSDEFGTPDHLPPKPYTRESLRLRAMYMLRQQDTLGHEGQSANFARVRFHDSVACWQFEYDFHPTRRQFLGDGFSPGAWMASFRPKRNWGPPYSGHATLPLRSLVPETTDGLLVAGKNLGFSSIVSSAVRLHDHSMAVGQASGAAAAVALVHSTQPREIPLDLNLLAEVRAGLCGQPSGGKPLLLSPFRDVQTNDAYFVAVNQLAARQALPLGPTDVSFEPNKPATDEWKRAVIARSLRTLAIDEPPTAPTGELTRGQFAQLWWQAIREYPLRQPERRAADDFDGDGIDDAHDAMPLDRGNDNLMDHLDE